MALNTNKFMNRIFRRVNGVVWDVTSGGIGLQTAEGIHSVTFAEDGTPTPNVNPIDSLGVALPAFATQTAYDDVQRGDIVVGDSAILGFVVEKVGTNSFKLLDHTGHTKHYTPPKVAVLGTSGTLVVRNLFSLTGGEAGAGNLLNQIAPLLMLGGGSDKLEKILPLLLMSGSLQGGAAPVAGAAPAAGLFSNPLVMLSLFKGGDGALGGLGDLGGGDPLKTMLMMQAFSGGAAGAAGGMNPLVLMSLLGEGGLGGSTAEPLPAPRAYGGVPVTNGRPALNRA